MSDSYDEALRTELEQKALAYGTTAAAFLDALGPDAFAVPQTLASAALSDTEDAIIADSSSSPQDPFSNAFLTFEVWLPDTIAPHGNRLVSSQELSDADAPPKSEDITKSLLAQTGDSGAAAAAIDEEARLIHVSLPIPIDEQTIAVAVGTLSAKHEFAFFAARMQEAFRYSVLLAVGIVGFVSLVGGGLSYVVSRDLTSRTRAEETLRAGEERARSVIDTAYDACMSIDAAGRITAWNARAEAMFGWPRSEAIGRRLVETASPPTDRAETEAIAKHLATGEGLPLNTRRETDCGPASQR